MLKKDLLEKIKNAKDDEDINSLLGGTDIEEQFKASGLTLEEFKDNFKSDKDFKAYLESENDKYHNKALDTWKKNNLEKELEPFITERYPDLVTDPAKKEAAEAKKEIEKLKAEITRKDLLNEATKYANEKGIKLRTIEKYLEDDWDSTKASLDELSEDWSKGLEAVATEKMKSNSYVPGTGEDGKPVSIGAAMAAQINNTSSVPSDPWASK
jgi:hypothetical protein